MLEGHVIGGVGLILLGIFIALGRFQRWEWVNNHHKVQTVEKILGEKGADNFYLILSIGSVVLGILTALKVIGNHISTSFMPREKRARRQDRCWWQRIQINTLCIIIPVRFVMHLNELKKIRGQLYQIAARHGIAKVYVFGSVARGESSEISDLDLLVEMETGASAFGVGAFQFEAQKLLGVQVDVIPTFTLPKIEDKNFVQSVQAEAVAL
ncbi:MAG: nucleotidyltransferase domain-containing protein [Anaerolineales bacterium]|nr:nucleotidyltransferase domain-containing protein [Anaerolineales bacterium]